MSDFVHFCAPSYYRRGTSFHTVDFASFPVSWMSAMPGELQVQMHSLDLQLAAGRVTLDAMGTTATAYKLAHQLAAAGSLLALPLADVPMLHVDVKATWLLPGGRDPGEHHVFPLEVCNPSPAQAIVVYTLLTLSRG